MESKLSDLFKSDNPLSQNSDGDKSYFSVFGPSFISPPPAHHSLLDGEGRYFLWRRLVLGKDVWSLRRGFGFV